MSAKRVMTLELLVKGLAMKYDGKTYDEIADTLGCSRTTVVRWLPEFERTLRKLYSQMKVEQGTVKTENLSEKLEKIQRDLDFVVNELKNVKELVVKLAQESKLTPGAPQGTS